MLFSVETDLKCLLTCLQGTALCIFTVLELVDEIAVLGPGPESERIVLVCAAGPLAGPLVGTTVMVLEWKRTLRPLKARYEG